MMWYVGLSDYETHIEYIVEIYSTIEFIENDYIKTDDYKIIIAKSNFKVDQWMQDGLELEPDVDFIFDDATNVVKLFFEKGI